MPNFSGIWSAAQQFQARGQNIWPKPPDAPTIGTATAGNSLCASVTFTAPACTGKYPAGVSSYTVTSTPGCFTASGAASPLTVTGLTNATSYTFKVKATGANGVSPCSAASNSVTASNAGSQSYTTAGTYTWVAPAGVTSVSVVAVGGGAGGYGSVTGAGGELRYINNTSVTPGSSYSVTVGAGGDHFLTSNQCHGKPSTFSSVIQANGGGVQNSWPGCGTAKNWQRTSGFGGTGFLGGAGRSSGYGGGGGAGGYAGEGGAGGAQFTSGSAGTGGGGGGGAGNRNYCGCVGSFIGGGGGGVGILGQGSNGAGGTYSGAGPTATGGGGGSGGSAGQTGSLFSGGCGGLYGGGGGASGNGNIAGYGAGGAVRIIWPGTTRQFPSTNTGSP